MSTMDQSPNCSNSTRASGRNFQIDSRKLPGNASASMTRMQISAPAAKKIMRRIMPTGWRTVFSRAQYQSGRRNWKQGLAQRVRPASAFVLNALHAEDRADPARYCARAGDAAAAIASGVVHSFECAERAALQNALLREQDVLR